MIRSPVARGRVQSYVMWPEGGYRVTSCDQREGTELRPVTRGRVQSYVLWPEREYRVTSCGQRERVQSYVLWPEGRYKATSCGQREGTELRPVARERVQSYVLWPEGRCRANSCGQRESTELRPVARGKVQSYVLWPEGGYRVTSCGQRESTELRPVARGKVQSYVLWPEGGYRVTSCGQRESTELRPVARGKVQSYVLWPKREYRVTNCCQREGTELRPVARERVQSYVLWPERGYRATSCGQREGTELRPVAREKVQSYVLWPEGGYRVTSCDQREGTELRPVTRGRVQSYVLWPEGGYRVTSCDQREGTELRPVARGRVQSYVLWPGGRLQSYVLWPEGGYRVTSCGQREGTELRPDERLHMSVRDRIVEGVAGGTKEVGYRSLRVGARDEHFPGNFESENCLQWRLAVEGLNWGGNFEAVPYPKADYGKFYTGDSYIVLFTRVNKGTFSWDIHFWLGNETSQITWVMSIVMVVRGRSLNCSGSQVIAECACLQDESGAAAILSVELDDSLGGAPVQYREVQEHESRLFLSHFASGESTRSVTTVHNTLPQQTGLSVLERWKFEFQLRGGAGVRYLAGGVASGFTHVDPDAVEKRLFQVKGKRNVRVRQVALNVSSMNKGDCFILDVGTDIYVYTGQNSKRTERLKAISAANQIRDQDHSGRARVHIIDSFSDAGEIAQFFEKLGSGSASEVAEEQVGGDDLEFERSQEAVVTLYKVSDDSGEMSMTKVGVKPLHQNQLNSSHIPFSSPRQDATRPAFGPTAAERTAQWLGEETDVKSVHLENTHQTWLRFDCFILDTVTSGIFVWIGKQCNKDEKVEAMRRAQRFLTSNNYPAWTTVSDAIDLIQRIVEDGEPSAFKQYFSGWRAAADQIGLGRVYTREQIAGKSILQRTDSW
uniref:Gelsolin-like domain-containing protein n=1 Tax=Timema douglasi TaxID=61478 RepID=A0A7R8VLZ8_TIMDO|nr:unnamed protein product [Timema douglasi]